MPIRFADHPSQRGEFTFARLVWGYANAVRLHHGTGENHAAAHCLKYIRYKLGGYVWTPYPHGLKR